MPTIDAFIIDSLRRRSGRAQPQQGRMDLPTERPTGEDERDRDRDRDRRPPEPPVPPEPRPRGVVVIDG